MTKVFENEYAELYDLNDEIPSVLFGYWKGFWELTDPEAMKALLFPLEYVKEKGIKIMLTDYTYLDVVSEEVNQWLSGYWFPTVVKNGLKSEIVIDSTALIGQLSVEFMYENVSESTGLFTPMVQNFEEGKELAIKLLKAWEQENN
ncbi:MAG: hypothetical protein EAZ97_15480 [Bacteroidetes bacterium]|nr:MAG: hypothetical protein EAZ97_15480 [Bacteroidota bacterium]